MSNPLDRVGSVSHADTMAYFVVGPEDAQGLRCITDEMERETEEFFADARLVLTDGEWELLSSYARACVQRALEVGVMLRALTRSLPSADFPYPGRGQEAFVRAGLAAWKDCFAPLAQVWRVASLFHRIPGGEARVLADIDALEVIAAGRMFTPLEEEYAALFPSDGCADASSD